MKTIITTLFILFTVLLSGCHTSHPYWEGKEDTTTVLDMCKTLRYGGIADCTPEEEEMRNITTKLLLTLEATGHSYRIYRKTQVPGYYPRTVPAYVPKNGGVNDAKTSLKALASAVLVINGELATADMVANALVAAKAAAIDGEYVFDILVDGSDADGVTMANVIISADLEKAVMALPRSEKRSAREYTRVVDTIPEVASMSIEQLMGLAKSMELRELASLQHIAPDMASLLAVRLAVPQRLDMSYQTQDGETKAVSTEAFEDIKVRNDLIKTAYDLVINWDTSYRSLSHQRNISIMDVNGTPMSLQTALSQADSITEIGLSVAGDDVTLVLYTDQTGPRTIEMLREAKLNKEREVEQVKVQELQADVRDELRQVIEKGCANSMGYFTLRKVVEKYGEVREGEPAMYDSSKPENVIAKVAQFLGNKDKRVTQDAYTYVLNGADASVDEALSSPEWNAMAVVVTDKGIQIILTHEEDAPIDGEGEE